jgi:hypothetical protein
LELVCEETGRSDTTKEGGMFEVILPDALLPGERIRLRVQQPDWQIWQRQPGRIRSGAAVAQAVEAYAAALEVFTRQHTPQQWAMIQNKLGTALQDQAGRSPGKPGWALLAQAVEAYRAALEVFTRGLAPQQWAMIQNTLGTALEEQGDRSPGEEGQVLRAQAAEHIARRPRPPTKATPGMFNTL